MVPVDTRRRERDLLLNRGWLARCTPPSRQPKSRPTPSPVHSHHRTAHTARWLAPAQSGTYRMRRPTGRPTLPRETFITDRSIFSPPRALVGWVERGPRGAMARLTPETHEPRRLQGHRRR